MSLDKNVMNKNPGDPIKSADWNALASETVRLNQSIGFHMLQAKAWSNATTSTDWTPVINETVKFDTPTSLLLIGQGHGSSDTQQISLRVAIRVNDTILASDPNGPWGAAFLYFANTVNNWVPLTAMAGCPVPQGTSKVELLIRREGTTGTVKMNAPTLWLLQLGTS
ncbi:hypothetical protein [Streptomyces griseoruber]|uniref:Uncharacterized protein n=1 Tax=Streptomyces griseoruber TaxID=1943 RepID=A0A124I3I5_9ACTN|nr:hypothetical protein [Streptomyces griseoruber]KUN83656.1 hypothetical protein AQJ64_16945 [Streptomyces griseoruber]